LAEVVGAGNLEAEDGVALASMTFSLYASSFSSESLSMMILPSPDDHRKLWLRSSKNLLANSSSYETSAMISPSSEDKERSTTGVFLEDPPCSHTGERRQCEETSGRDINDSGDPEGAGGGVLAPSGDGLPSLEGE
jgi:hypothetical protein